MVLSLWKCSTIIHLRIVSGGDISQRVFKLTILQIVIAYLVMKVINISLPVGWILMEIGICQMVAMTVYRRLSVRSSSISVRWVGIQRQPYS